MKISDQNPSLRKKHLTPAIKRGARCLTRQQLDRLKNNGIELNQKLAKSTYKEVFRTNVEGVVLLKSNNSKHPVFPNPASCNLFGNRVVPQVLDGEHAIAPQVKTISRSSLRTEVVMATQFDEPVSISTRQINTTHDVMTLQFCHPDFLKYKLMRLADTLVKKFTNGPKKHLRDESQSEKEKNLYCLRCINSTQQKYKGKDIITKGNISTYFDSINVWQMASQVIGVYLLEQHDSIPESKIMETQHLAILKSEDFEKIRNILLKSRAFDKAYNFGYLSYGDKLIQLQTLFKNQIIPKQIKSIDENDNKTSLLLLLKLSFQAMQGSLVVNDEMNRYLEKEVFSTTQVESQSDIFYYGISYLLDKARINKEDQSTIKILQLAKDLAFVSAQATAENRQLVDRKLDNTGLLQRVILDDVSNIVT